MSHDHHDHDHSHHNHHEHSHAPASFGRAFAIGITLNIGFVLAEAFYGWRRGSILASFTNAVLLLVAGTWSLFRKSLHLLFDGVPDHVDLAQARQCLLTLPGVVAVHDLHVWAMSAAENALTAHLVVDEMSGDHAAEHDALLRLASARLRETFGIEHVSLQRESLAFAAECPANKGQCAGV